MSDEKQVEFGVKLDRLRYCWVGVPARGCIWVSPKEDEYVTHKEAKRWATREDAEACVTEPWEAVVVLP